MYYVNLEQIERRLGFLPVIAQACRELGESRRSGGLIETFAEQRALHLAIESVTDIGSLLIDGFLMRDASSYEDIMEILRVERVFPDSLGEPLIRLVKLRKTLVQDYADLDRTPLDPWLAELPALLETFAFSVRSFVEKELQ